jgi:DNA-binding transcriptional LysR family regulator
VIDKLEFLLALARERHFGRAAETCGVTQPTLSAGIKLLEDMLGVLLVQRGSRFHSFTPEGERALDWARRIVGDTRAMRQEIAALKRGLSGHIRIAAVPTALGMVPALTTPYRARHPDVSFTILSRTSIEIFAMIENIEVDAGLTYLDNEPLGRVRTVPLYREHYRLITAADGLLGDRDTVTWREIGQIPLCLLTPDMQNRRIIDRRLRSAGCEPSSSVLPARLADALGLTDTVRAIPITGGPDPHPTIGLVVPQREPMTPLTAALVSEAGRLASVLGDIDTQDISTKAPTSAR